MMIVGFSSVGALLRRNRRRRRAARLIRGAAAAAELLSSAGLGSAQTAALASSKASATAGASLASLVAKKALVCVCSGTILTAVTTLPPVKHAVHAATSPARLVPTGDCQPA
jgi:hypothetical protein